MLTYVFKRLVAMVPTLFGITLVTFLIISLAPGDPVAISMGQEGGGGPSQEGGGGSRERLADTIKAKKKLLGIVTEDRAVLAWRLDGAARQGETAPLDIAGRLRKQEGWLRALALDPQGQLVYAAGDEGALLAFDLDGKGERVLNAENPASIRALAVSPDGRLVATGDTRGEVRLVPSAGGTAAELQPASGRPVHALAFLPDGRGLLAASDDGAIRLLRLPDGGVERVFQDHVAGVYALAVAADGSRFWSAGYDRKIREWETATGRLLRSLGEHGQAVNDLVLAPDGSFLVSACDDRIIRILPLDESAGPVRELVGHFKEVTALALAPDGSRLISGGRDETLRTWDLSRALAGDPAGAAVAQTPEAVGRVADLVALADGRALSVGESWARVPIWKRYLRWLGRVLTLDFDRSFKDNRPVIEKIGRALPVTLGLNLIALTLIYLFSIPIGVMAAVRRGTAFDHVSSLIIFMLYSMPSFWVATLLIMGFSSKLTWDLLPSVGLHADNADQLSYFQWLADWGAHLVLPIVTMTYAGFASLSRYARTSMLEAIGQDYVRTARAKGLSERAVVYKHALRNSLITIVTLVATLLPAMIGGSVIVEYIFSIDGMGKLGFDAILARDYPVTMAITTCAAFLTLVGILVSDLLYSIVDPRISHE